MSTFPRGSTAQQILHPAREGLPQREQGATRRAQPTNHSGCILAPYPHPTRSKTLLTTPGNHFQTPSRFRNCWFFILNSFLSRCTPRKHYSEEMLLPQTSTTRPGHQPGAVLGLLHTPVPPGTPGTFGRIGARRLTRPRTLSSCAPSPRKDSQEGRQAPTQHTRAPGPSTAE